MLDTQPAPRGTRGTRREIRPTGQERTFGVDELIVSKTDSRGVITHANDVFLRVSGYEMDEVVGRSHALAHVTPSYGPGGRVIGYHSNRRKPSRAPSSRSSRSTPGCSPRSAGTRTRRRP